MRINAKACPERKFIEALKAEGIPCAPVMSAFTGKGCSPLPRLALPQGRRKNYDIFLPNSEKKPAMKRNVAVPVYAPRTQKDMDDVADAIIKIYENVDELSESLQD